MKKEELHIGATYRSVKFNTPVTLTLSDFTQLEIMADGAELTEDIIAQMFAPLELNEGWLKRMGFEYFTAAKFWRLKGFIVYYDTENELFWCSISESLIVQLYHVHTLQNAFSLTGHELEIK